MTLAGVFTERVTYIYIYLFGPLNETDMFEARELHILTILYES